MPQPLPGRTRRSLRGASGPGGRADGPGTPGRRSCRSGPVPLGRGRGQGPGTVSPKSHRGGYAPRRPKNRRGRTGRWRTRSVPRSSLCPGTRGRADAARRAAVREYGGFESATTGSSTAWTTADSSCRRYGSPTAVRCTGSSEALPTLLGTRAREGAALRSGRPRQGAALRGGSPEPRQAVRQRPTGPVQPTGATGRPHSGRAGTGSLRPGRRRTRAARPGRRRCETGEAVRRFGGSGRGASACGTHPGAGVSPRGRSRSGLPDHEQAGRPTSPTSPPGSPPGRCRRRRRRSSCPAAPRYGPGRASAGPAPEAAR